MEKEYLDDVITLIDEDGNQVEFELIMSIEANDHEYAILAPLYTEEEEEDEAYIFRLEYDENDEMLLLPIDDDEEYEMVVEVYNTLIDEE